MSTGTTENNEEVQNNLCFLISSHFSDDIPVKGNLVKNKVAKFAQCETFTCSHCPWNSLLSLTAANNVATRRFFIFATLQTNRLCHLAAVASRRISKKLGRPHAWLRPEWKIGVNSRFWGHQDSTWRLTGTPQACSTDSVSDFDAELNFSDKLSLAI